MQAVPLLRRGVQAILAPTILLTLTTYFIWNALNGAHGIQAYKRQLHIKAQAEKALQEAHQEQDIWRLRVKALSKNSLDPDMLDERSRAMLNNSQEGDLIIPYQKHDHLY